MNPPSPPPTGDAPRPPSRRDSPTPPPPVAESPGPRATALQRVFAEALAHTLKTCSYKNFAACFPTPAQHVPESLQDLWRNFTQQLEERCKVGFGCYFVVLGWVRGGRGREGGKEVKGTECGSGLRREHQFIVAERREDRF